MTVKRLPLNADDEDDDEDDSKDDDEDDNEDDDEDDSKDNHIIKMTIKATIEMAVTMLPVKTNICTQPKLLPPLVSMRDESILFLDYLKNRIISPRTSRSS